LLVGDRVRAVARAAATAADAVEVYCSWLYATPERAMMEKDTFMLKTAKCLCGVWCLVGGGWYR